MINEESQCSRSTELLHSFWHIHGKMMRLVQKTAVANELSVPQYSILMTMMHNEEMVQKIIREKTLLPKSTLSQAIDGLVQSDLLKRQYMEDNRREVQLSISDRGRELIKKIHSQEDSIHQLFHDIAGSFTNEQYENLRDAHKQILSYLEEHGRDNQ